jgi:general secretion pathway protein E
MNAKDDVQLKEPVERTASATGLADFLAARLPLTGVAASPARAESYRAVHDSSGLTDGQFADAVALYMGCGRIAYADLATAEPLVPLFTRRFLRDAVLYPFRADDGGAAIAVAEPPNEMVLRASSIVLGARPAIRVASYEDLAQILTERLADEERTEHAPADDRSGSAHDDLESLRDLASGAPVVRAVNDFLEKAMELRATDVHIEPFRNGLTVRMRVDGLLRAVPAPPLSMAQAIVSRVKILAGLNIAERRVPQDGAARLRLAGGDIDIRIATMPTGHGESAVIRLLPRDRGLLDLKRVGLNARDEATVRRLLQLPHGLIAITGPTGSGKTTTLACALSILNEPGRKILTIEDPIEYEISGINQSQVKPSVGLTFASAMRAFVRQDPDVIMVGEVRDGETAGTAINAALTGHLVLTTLHTETSTAAVSRLLDLGVEGFLIQSTLRGIVAQRLVRVLCDHCKRRLTLDKSAIDADPRFLALGFALGETVCEPVGCERCGGTGYRGRRGIFEVLEMNDAIRQLIGARTDPIALERAARAAGLTTMVDDATAHCRAGTTSVAEVLRVTTIR